MNKTNPYLLPESSQQWENRHSNLWNQSIDETNHCGFDSHHTLQAQRLRQIIVEDRFAKMRKQSVEFIGIGELDQRGSIMVSSNAFDSKVRKNV